MDENVTEESINDDCSKRNKRGRNSENNTHLKSPPCDDKYSAFKFMPPVNEIKPHKKKDVERILVTQFGDEWVEYPEIEWYKEVIQTACKSTDTIGIDEAGESYDVDNYECLELDITEVVN